MDEVFERILVDYDGQRSVFTMGKMGVLWELALETGQFRSARDLGYQTFADVDPATGQVTYREGMDPVLGQGSVLVPEHRGIQELARHVVPPRARDLLYPGQPQLRDAVFGPVDKVAGRGGTGPVRRTNHMHPDSPDQMGELLAMSMRTGEVRWRFRTRTPINTAALTTAGDLVVAGDWDRHLYVFDAADGDILWQTRLPQSLQGFPSPMRPAARSTSPCRPVAAAAAGAPRCRPT